MDYLSFNSQPWVLSVNTNVKAALSVATVKSSVDPWIFSEPLALTIQLYESNPVSIILPDHASLKVIESDAVVKGQTAASSYKPAILEGNIKISVPSFIEVGDEVVINTHNYSYIEKAKKQ